MYKEQIYCRYCGRKLTRGPGGRICAEVAGYGKVHLVCKNRILEREVNMGEESWRFNPKKIKELRECLTYHTFGRLMDKPKPGHVIKAWELGKSKPGAESIAALCDVTGKSPNYFFTN